MASAPSIVATLPSELLSLIFEHLSNTPRGLVQCMLCCRTWHDEAQAILFQHVALSSSTATKYTKLCPSSPNTDAKIQSLTVHLDDVYQSWPKRTRDGSIRDVRVRSQPTHEVWHALDVLSLRFAAMPKLRSLSLARPSDRPRLLSEWNVDSVIGRMISKLPATCVSLEIDVNTAEAKTHVCPAVRAALPQLEYLRLRLSSICPEICGEGYGPGPAIGVAETFRPASAPYLKQCVINMVIDTPNQFHQLGTRLCSANPPRAGPAWPHLTNHLEALHDAETAPNLVSLWILTARGITTCYIRHDIGVKKVTSMPVRQIGDLERDI